MQSEKSEVRWFITLHIGAKLLTFATFSKQFQLFQKYYEGLKVFEY